jgi:transposase InsO family protein
VTEVYLAIVHMEQDHEVSVVCQTLNVSRSAYYDWRKRATGPRQREDSHLNQLIDEVFWEHKRRYGARRIAKELEATGRACSRRRVGRLMEEMDLVAIQPRSFKPRTTDSTHSLGYSPNLLIGAAPPAGVNQIWVGDITYVPLTSSEFVYLALLMDRFSRRIVGWELVDHLQETLVLSALRRAIAFRQPKPGLIHHTDRGGQYAGTQYRKILQRARMKQSMSRANDCYDNAFMESCFGTIKTELEMTRYENESVAYKEIGQFIRYYNTRRRHSSLGYLTPDQFEQETEMKRPMESEPQNGRCPGSSALSIVR